MRVALVAPLVTAICEPQLGGSQALLADVASGLTGRGHDVTVFAASGSSIEGVRVVDVGIDPSMLRATFFRASEEAGDFDITRDAFAHVYGLVTAGSFDVVHNHAFDAPAIELAPADVAMVHTLHLPPSAPMVSAVERARRRAHPVVACVSEPSAREWRAAVAVDVVLPNGVPTDRIAWSRDRQDGLLFAGRLSPEKGALEAIAIALEAGEDLTVVGDPYDEAYADRVRTVAGEHDAVTVRRAVPRARLWELMAVSRAVLCPVSWDEPFGLVAAEAQAAGTPVVAFDRGALGEVVEHEVTGFVVPDANSAVEALRRVDSIDRAACRRRAERELPLERTLDAHEALYGRLTQARPPRSA